MLAEAPGVSTLTRTAPITAALPIRFARSIVSLDRHGQERR